MMKVYIYIGLLLLLVSTAMATTVETYQFVHPSQEQRFHMLIGSLRCLVCQNQNLADSNAPLAKDLRNEVYRQIILGKNDVDITKYLTARYGDYVLFNPPFNKATLILWLGPLGFLVIAMVLLFKTLRTKSKKPNQETFSSRVSL